MPHRSKVGLLVAVLCLGAGPPRRYRNDDFHVLRFEPPPGWERAPQASYPRLLVSYSQPSGAKLALTAERMQNKLSSLELASMSRAALVRQGFSQIKFWSEEERTLLSAKLDGGRKVARQAYLVVAEMGYVVTLIGPAAQRTNLERDFEETLRSFQIEATDGGEN